MREIKQKQKAVIYLFFGMLVAASLFLFGNAQAQTGDQLPPESGQTNLINCFQYYNFGSVDIRIDPSRYTYQSSETMVFKGTLENKNDYPVVDGEVYVKIYRRDSGSENARNGDFQIAEFKALKGINIDSRAKKGVNFDYRLPERLAPGEYLAQFFFEVSGKYNLAGLSFHSSMPGSVTSFAVKSAAGGAVYFDKDNVKVNGKPYGFRQVSQPEQSENGITVSAPLKNPTAEAADIEIQKDIFFWDALDEKNKLNSESEKITLPPNGSVDVSYAIPKPQYSVYLIRFTAKGSAGQSIIGVRPTVNGIFQPRLNYPALASFPLKSGQKSVLFTCFHNAGVDRNKGRVILILKDDQGNIIKEHSYDGDVTGEMLGTAAEFVPEKNYNKVTLLAEIYNDKGELADSSVENYDCNRFDPSICETSSGEPASPLAITLPPEEPFAATSPLFWLVDYRGGKIILEIFAGIVLLIVAGIVVKKTVLNKEIDQNNLNITNG